MVGSEWCWKPRPRSCPKFFLKGVAPAHEGEGLWLLGSDRDLNAKLLKHLDPGQDNRVLLVINILLLRRECPMDANNPSNADIVPPIGINMPETGQDRYRFLLGQPVWNACPSKPWTITTTGSND